MAAEDLTSKAKTVIVHARDAVETFLTAFETIYAQQGRGRPGHAEQDQLRAALVFAAAGLDSTLKELIRGTVRDLATFDSAVRKELETFVSRQIRGEGDDLEANYGSKFLAKILVSDTPLQGIIEEYVLELTGASLQSADQVFKTLRALGLNPSEIAGQMAHLKKIFSIRNQIIHELDVNLRAQQGRRNRNDRARDEMTEYAELLLNIAERTIQAVEVKFEQTV